MRARTIRTSHAKNTTKPGIAYPAMRLVAMVASYPPTPELIGKKVPEVDGCSAKRASARSSHSGRALGVVRVAGGAHAGSLLDVFLHDLRGCGRRIIDYRAVLPGRPVVRGQVRNRLTGRRAQRQIPRLVAVAFVGGGTRVKHDARGEAGFVDLAHDGAARAPPQGSSGGAASLADGAGGGAGPPRPLP